MSTVPSIESNFIERRYYTVITIILRINKPF